MKHLNNKDAKAQRVENTEHRTSNAEQRISETNVIGRLCMVRDEKAGKTIVRAVVIDAVAGTNRAKRVRLQSGECFGEVRMPGEYTLMEFLTPGHGPGCIGEVMGD